MKKSALILFMLLMPLWIPTLTDGAFFGKGVPLYAVFPDGTYEGSGFTSKAFTAVGGNTITFSYNFITSEAIYDNVTGTWSTTSRNDWFGVGLYDALSDELLHIEIIGSANSFVDASGWQLASFNGISAPHGDFDGRFVAQTGVIGHNFLIPKPFDGREVRFGIGIFDLLDWGYASALLVDNINLPGGSFDDDPFAATGYFGLDTGTHRRGLAAWLAPGSLTGVDEPGETWLVPGSLTGADEPGANSFAYISSYDGKLAAVSEPSTILLITTGLLGLARLRKNFRNQPTSKSTSYKSII